VKKLYVNSTLIPQIYYDMWRNAHILQPGESRLLTVAEEEVLLVKSIPPGGMQKVVNIYRNPETGRMEIEFNDVPIE